MFYEFHLTIQPNTADPLQSVPCDLDYGIITHVEMEFPPGCNGLVGVRVREREHQLYPTNDGEFVVSNAYVVAFNDAYKFFSKPYLAFFEGYNSDEVYPHTITLRVVLIRPEDTLARAMSDIFFGLQYSPFGESQNQGGANG